MMRYLSALLLGLVLLSSCSDTIDTSLENRERNEKAFAEYATRRNYSQVRIPGLMGRDGFVYMEWLSRGADTAPMPKVSDLVRMHYRGYFLTTGTQFDGNFDREAQTIDPVRVYSYIPGMSVALQNMRVGDHVQIIIPWYLAYGQMGRGSIPAYSALRFEVRLNEIVGDAVTD